MAIYREAKVDVRAVVQIDWSRGGDACVASKDVRTVEDILGRRSAMMLFSPDHTVFEFMIVNSRLDRAQLAVILVGVLLFGQETRAERRPQDPVRRGAHVEAVVDEQRAGASSAGQAAYEAAIARKVSGHEAESMTIDNAALWISVRRYEPRC